jgi:hypothetical protein
MTLYGLIETARLFEAIGSGEEGSAAKRNALGAAIGSYVKAHTANPVRALEYALAATGTRYLDTDTSGTIYRQIE